MSKNNGTNNKQKNLMRFSILICIPTYNNPNFIKEIFDTELKICRDLNFGIEIDDSSTNDETAQVVRPFLKDPYVLYHRYPSDISSNEKVYRILESVDQDNVNYVWIRSDALRASEMLLKYLHLRIAEGFDLILTIYQDTLNAGVQKVDDPQYIFENYAMWMCLYGSTVLRTDTFLSSVNWNYYRDKYISSIPSALPFSHVCFEMERMLELSIFHGLILNLTEDFYTGTSEKKKSLWNSITFQLWLEIWPDAINMLPAIYKNKEKVIKSFGTNTYYYTLQSLNQYASEGILTKEVLDHYNIRIQKYAGVSMELFQSVLNNKKISNPNIQNDNMIFKRIFEFCNQYNDIVIYGCGGISRQWTYYLDSIGKFIKAFVVSDENRVNEVGKKFLNRPVITLEKLKKEYLGEGVILALNSGNQYQVYWNIQDSRILKNCLFMPDIRSSIQLHQELKKI